jgi:Poly(ADP-ribose) polymerase and DNA-Ligase Zn-finger region
VPHVFEPAASGRSKCRGCGQSIARGEFRFGENLPNLFGEGEMTLWFHLTCAAYKRPQSFLEALGTTPANVPDREALERAAQSSMAFRRNPRIDGAERSPTGQARCRSCHQLIERGAWRIRIAHYEEGRFFPGGFLHLSCRKPYFEDHDVLDQLLHFSPDLSENEREDLKRMYLSSSL